MIRICCINVVRKNLLDIDRVYRSIMTRSRGHTTQVITYKSIQRMIEGAKLAVEQKVIDENSKLLEELVEYSKISLILENAQVRYLNTRVDRTNNCLFLYHREALFEELKSLFMYPVSSTSIKKFKMPIERFMELIGRPVVSLGLLARRHLSKKITFGDLMDIDFHIQDISLEDLQSIGYYTTAAKLKTIKLYLMELGWSYDKNKIDGYIEVAQTWGTNGLF